MANEAEEKEPAPSEISLESIGNKQLLILYRQTRNLLKQSNEGLLSPAATSAFSEAVKLRQLLLKEELERLNEMSEEQLEKMAQDRGIDD